MATLFAEGQEVKHTGYPPPENTLNELIEALQSGKSERVKEYCTEKGFQNLISHISPYNENEPFSVTFKNWGTLWPQFHIDMTMTTGNSSVIMASKDNIKYTYRFIWLNEGWKLNEWTIE